MTPESPEIVTPAPRLVVAIGASAGGLVALETFFDNVLPNSQLAFVVVSHQQAGNVSLMPDLLSNHTVMKVETAMDGRLLEPDHVYVSPADGLLEISNGRFVVVPWDERSRAPFVIDHFFSSLAVDQGPRAVAVVLSGAGSDGAAGVRTIKEEFGLIVVQDPNSAQFSSMPSAAIATREVDHVVVPAEMPALLLQYAAAPADSRAAAEGMKDLPIHLPSIVSLLRAHCGHDFSGYKPSTLLRRIQRRMSARRVRDAREYVEHLRADSSEAGSLFQELMIGVTSFFRDPDAFEALRKAFVTQLRSGEVASSIRGWVAGCSTGEEAYSLAMLAREAIDEVDRYGVARIFATDIDPRAMSVARQGIYPADIAAKVSSERLGRFFVADDDQFQVRGELRELMIFAVHNLISDPPFTRIDVLSCRNLLIYLDAKLQREVLALFHYALKPGGLLFLGSAETLGAFSEGFSPIDKRWNIFRKKDISLRVRTGLPFSRHVDPLTFQAPPNPASRVGVTALAESVLASVLVGPSVIVDEHGQILHLHGRTGEFLEPTPGEPNMNLFRMAREGLRAEIPAAIRQVAHSGVARVLKGRRVKSNGDAILVDVRVCRVDHSPFGAQAFIVVFERQNPHEVVLASEVHAANFTPKQLELEVQALKETLQSTIEEYETANEELMASNEELQSANEELQSANEELETSKEEQQSLNEELQTVNAELQGKVENSSRAHDDMRNLLNGTDVATLFLDTELRIKRFTPGATRVVNLIHADVGRPISDFGMKVEAPNLAHDMDEVLRTLVFKQSEVRGGDGTWYLMRILPYRTAENVIDGVVVTFVDVTELKRIQQQAARERQIMERLVREVADPMMILDMNQRVVVANAAFVELTAARREILEGQPIFNVLPELRAVAESLQGNDDSGQLVSLELPRGLTNVFLISERLNSDGQPGRTLVSFKLNGQS